MNIPKTLDFLHVQRDIDSGIEVTIWMDWLADVVRWRFSDGDENYAPLTEKMLRILGRAPYVFAYGLLRERYDWLLLRHAP